MGKGTPTLTSIGGYDEKNGLRTNHIFMIVLVDARIFNMFVDFSKRQKLGQSHLGSQTRRSDVQF